MNDHLTILQKCPLFSGISEAELRKILACVDAKPRDYEAGSLVLREGDTQSAVCILLSGRLILSRPDFFDREEFMVLVPGDMTGIPEAFLSSKLDYSATAEVGSVVLFIEANRLLEPCASTCGCHLRAIRNLARQLAVEDAENRGRIRHLCRRSTREKLLSYLCREATLNHSDIFDIPLDRKTLADYLAVDRSAMSNELSKLRTSGIIEFERNHFILKKENNNALH